MTARRRRTWMSPSHVVAMGLLFAFLQSGYFFQLQFRLTAAYPSFLATTLAWLLGSIAGVWLGGREEAGGRSIRRVLWLAASLGAYYLVLWLLRRFPYRTEWLPVLGLLIAVSGIQAGHFFGASRSLFKSAGRLFFWENNGFVLGWIAAFVGYVQLGSIFHWVAPALAGLVAAGLRGRES